ncbi:hypothetical protein R3P38DRAFT_3211395 [Favolaschia claudopus]|uniref:Uncharacterized protein n=1 Tax=Favolaschia claudopus TaxID=2862362 RepID=A0AAW0AFF7_9AGAR
MTISGRVPSHAVNFEPSSSVLSPLFTESGAGFPITVASLSGYPSGFQQSELDVPDPCQDMRAL